jgi:Cdc6-like AAA superfamily ATPase
VESNKSDAVEQQQSQAFEKLDSDIQNLITQIASGNVKIEDLLVQESKVTRDMIITSLASEFDSFDVRTVTEAQRQRLLKSLKSEDIRKRYNEVISPSDACFERVFASYERICTQDPKHKAWSNFDETINHHADRTILGKEVDEIDLAWSNFSAWLPSNDNIFWVQGKPGSGKSTLMKFIINSDNTKSLLDSWNQDIRVLSHFFWKIGNEPQNSIKGLLCSLLHDILSNDTEAVELVLRHFAFTQCKDNYQEWSTEEADEVLFSLLHASSRSTCIFIDGLDEISDKDGFRALMLIVERLWSCPKVKVCASSRPETELVSRFKAMKVPNLQLEDLTRPEMAIYIHNELDRFPGQISASIVKAFKYMLLQKAQGVFLWLVLATESLTRGIENGDDEKLLVNRLEELPGELEALYEDMWLRLGGNNRVYRETAAKYFNCVVYGGWDHGISFKSAISTWSGNHTPTLAHLSLVTKTRSQMFFPPGPGMEDLKWLNILCDKTADDIKTRCAGMLRIGSPSIRQYESCKDIDVVSEMLPLTRPVEFIHRTAHDFLVDTESGQAILNYRTDAQALLNLHINLAQSWLYLVSLHSQFMAGFVQNFCWVVKYYVRLEGEGANKSTVLSLLWAIQDLYEAGAINLDITIKRFSLPPKVFFGTYFKSFEETFLSHCVRPDTTGLLNASLQGIAVLDGYILDRGPPVNLIKQMIGLGGDPHAIGTPPVLQEASEKGLYISRQTTAFELFLHAAVARFGRMNKPPIDNGSLDVIIHMAQTCQGWHRKRLITYAQGINNRLIMNPFWTELLHLNHRMPGECKRVVFEVDMRFLLVALIHALQDCGLQMYVDKLRGIVGFSPGVHVRIRHITATRREDKEEAFCYRMLAQGPFQDFIDGLCSAQKAKMTSIDEVVSLMDSFEGSDAIRSASDSRSMSFEGSFIRVTFVEQLDSLVEEGFLLRTT